MKHEQIRRQPSRLERERRRERRDAAPADAVLNPDTSALDTVDEVLADIDEVLTKAA